MYNTLYLSNILRLFIDRPALEKEVTYVDEYRNLLKRQQKIEVWINDGWMDNPREGGVIYKGY